jgi:hypothetical protein
MVQSSRGGWPSPGLGGGEGPIWKSYQYMKQLLAGSTTLMSTMVKERGARKSGMTKSGEKGTFALVEGRHLSMRARTLGDCANPTALEDEAEFISNLVTDSSTAPWRRSSFTAAYEVTRISSKGH